MEKPELEKIIRILEKIDLHEWKSSLYLDGNSDYYFNNGYPVLSVNFQGLSFHFIKFQPYKPLGRSHYHLEVSNIEKDLRLFSYNKERKLLKNVYEKTFEKLKDNRQKESEKSIEELREKLNETPE